MGVNNNKLIRKGAEATSFKIDFQELLLIDESFFGLELVVLKLYIVSQRAIFWNLFCAFEGIRAILTGLSVDALTTIIRLVGRRHRSFSNISITKDLPTAFAKSFFSGAMLSF